MVRVFRFKEYDCYSTFVSDTGLILNIRIWVILSIELTFGIEVINIPIRACLSLNIGLLANFTCHIFMSEYEERVVSTLV